MSSTPNSNNELPAKTEQQNANQTPNSGAQTPETNNTNSRQQQSSNRKRRGGGGGGGGQHTHSHSHSQERHSWTRLTGAPVWDLSPIDTQTVQTFTGRCRLFVANLPSSVTEQSLRSLFEPFGAVADVYIGKGNTFAFVKMDTRQNAETAKQQLDSKSFEGRVLRVRLAAHAAAIRVTNLPPAVSNELLHYAFSSFGAVERAIVSADDRGRSLGEGIVEFARKSSAQAAIKKCENECLILTTSPMPVVVTSLESRDEEEGVPEKSILHSADYRIEREIGPRFAEVGSVEYEMARKWKQLHQIEVQRKEALEAEFRDARDALKSQIEYYKIEETTKQLRERLRQMENESQKLCAEREARIESERRREEQRRTQELVLRQQEEALLRRSGGGGGGPGSGIPNEHELTSLRRQESELRQQANALQQLLDRQEAALRAMNSNDMNQNNSNFIHSSLESQNNIFMGHTNGPHMNSNLHVNAMLGVQQQQGVPPPASHAMRPQFNARGIGGGPQGMGGGNFKRRRF